MADTYTTRLRFQQPQINADNNLWGGYLNTDLQLIDDAITGDNNYAGGSGSGINIAGQATYSLSANQGSTDQARQMLYPFTGALTAGCLVTIPGVVKMGWALNATTGGQTVTLTTGGGATLPLPFGVWVFFYCDGTNVTAPTFGNSVAFTTITATTADIVTLNVSGNADVTGNLGVDGAVTIDQTLAVTGSLTAGPGGSFQSSLGSSGYQELPGGFIEQWGSGVTTAAGVLITFPIPFPTAVLNVTATVAGTAAGGSYMTFDAGVTLTQCTFYAWINNTTQVAGAGFSWRAIGH